MTNIAKTLFSPKTRNRTFSFALVIIAYIVLQVMINTGNLSRLMTSLLVPVSCYAIAAVGLNLNVGISGELNLGQAGFMSVGGFTAAVVCSLLAQSVPSGVLRLAIGVLAGALASGLLGWLISIPVLKLQGDYLAIVTLAFGQIIMSLINALYIGFDSNGIQVAFINNTLNIASDGTTILSGPMGVVGNDRLTSFTACVVVLLISLYMVYNLMYSKSGRAVMACRDNRIAAETVGINVSRTKTLAFVMSSALAGAAGALYLMNYSSVAATKFDFNTSILILVYIVLGGLGNMTGTLIATSLLVILPEMLRFLSGYRMLIYAIVLIAIMLITNNPHIAVMLEQLKAKFTKKGAADND